MNIRTATEDDRQRWDQYALNHDEGVAYHQFGWGQAVKKAYGFQPYYLLAEEQGIVCGILPMSLLTIPLLKSELISLPYCDLGGVLADNKSIGDELTAAAIEKAKQTGTSKIELRQEMAESDEATVGKVRMLLELPASADELMASFKAKLRSQVKKPMKDGLTGELGGTEFLDDFYHVFSINMRDLGSPVHSLGWFREVLAQYEGNVKVGLVRAVDGSVIAAGIILLHKKVISIPWASTLRRYNRLSPNMLLYWTFLSFAADNGHSFFDFGRSTPGEGTYRFKEQWGAKPRRLKWIDLLNQDYAVSDGLPIGKSYVRTIVEGAWKKLPLKMSLVLGPSIRKYVSL